MVVVIWEETIKAPRCLKEGKIRTWEMVEH